MICQIPTSTTRGRDARSVWWRPRLEVLEDRCLPSGGVTIFGGATGGPQEVATGPDGNLWFTEAAGNEIGKLNITTGAVTQYAIPTANSDPFGIVAGPDGNLWFTEILGNKIGKITTSGSITEYTVPTVNSEPAGITSIAAGTTLGLFAGLYFAEETGNKIGYITTSGTFSEFTVPTASSQPFLVTTDGGTVWFTEAAGQIGELFVRTIIPFRIIQVREMPIPTANSHPEGITLGPDQNLWFTDADPGGYSIANYNPTNGTFSKFLLPAGHGLPVRITPGPDGSLWFSGDTNFDGTNTLGRITTAGAITEYSIPIQGPNHGFSITQGPDSNLWFAADSNLIGRLIPDPPIVITTTTNLNAVEGVDIFDTAFFTATSTASDPKDASSFSALINWGDGNSSAEPVYKVDTDRYEVIAAVPYQYTEESSTSLTGSVHITDIDNRFDVGGNTASATFSVTVSDAPLEGVTGISVKGQERMPLANVPVAIFADANANPLGTLGDFRAMVNWGDGSSPTAGVIQANADGSYSVLGTHTYARAGDFSVQVSIQDVGGATAMASGNATIANTDIIATGSGIGIPAMVNVYDAQTGVRKFSFQPYESTFKGGVRVAVADINGDGIPDIITVPGGVAVTLVNVNGALLPSFDTSQGRAPEVKVFSGVDGHLLEDFMAYDPSFRAGLFVAVGDINGDQKPDIITAPDATGQPGHTQVRVFFNGNTTGTPDREFNGYDPGFGGGVRLAVADDSGNGFGDIITTPGIWSGPDVRIFDGKGLAQTGAVTLDGEFLAYDFRYFGGVFVATGDVNADGHPDIVTGTNGNGGPEVKAFDGKTVLGNPAPAILDDFFAYNPAFNGGASVAVLNIGGDATASIVTGAGPGGGPHVRVFDGATELQLPNAQDSFYAYDPSFTGGVYVGGA